MIHDFDKMLTDSKKPFAVPEGYFDTLEDRIMQRIPQNEVRIMPTDSGKKTKILTLWKRYAAAAAVVAAIVGAVVFMPRIERNDGQVPMAKQQTTTTTNDNSNVDAMADYIMADDYELYSYIADGEY